MIGKGAYNIYIYILYSTTVTVDCFMTMSFLAVADSGCFRGRDEKVKRVPAVCGAIYGTELHFLSWKGT